MKTIEQLLQDKEKMSQAIHSAIREFMLNNPDVVPDIQCHIRSEELLNGKRHYWAVVDVSVTL